MKSSAMKGMEQGTWMLETSKKQDFAAAYESHEQKSKFLFSNPNQYKKLECEKERCKGMVFTDEWKIWHLC